MSGDFTRTLRTAGEADSTAALLDRAASQVRGHADGQRLRDLAGRYRDYAAALRETAAPEVEEPAPDQRILPL